MSKKVELTPANANQPPLQLILTMKGTEIESKLEVSAGNHTINVGTLANMILIGVKAMAEATNLTEAILWKAIEEIKAAGGLPPPTVQSGKTRLN